MPNALKVLKDETQSWSMTVAEFEAITAIQSLNQSLNQRFGAICDEAFARLNLGKGVKLAFDLNKRQWLRAEAPEVLSNGEAPKA